MNGIRFAHTNIIADDWRSLARFYVDVFGCAVLQPERDLSGDWIDTMTGIENSKIRGVHIALPGFENPPTLEIFGFEPHIAGTDNNPVNMKGIRHIAFHCDDLDATVKKFIEHGGTELGEMSSRVYDGYGEFRGIYMKDPEGNIVELQNWKKF